MSPEPPHGALIAERFRPDGSALAGGMGAVVRCVDEQTGDFVALKRPLFPDAAALARFQREAEILRRLVHPRVVRCIAHGTDARGPWMAMEWLEGPTLEGLIARGAVRLELAVELGAQIADAVAAAHEQGVVHRDIKPANIIVQAESPPSIKLIDFGIARPLDARTVLTQTGTALGTPLYMAPEQLRGEVPEPATDVYAVAAVLFELLAGRPPFVAESGLAVIGRVLLETAPRVSVYAPAAPEALCECVARGLAKNAAERPGGAHLAAELRRLAHSLAVRDTVADLSLAPRPDVTRERRTAAVLIVRGARSALPVLDGETTTGIREVLPDGTALLLITDPSAPDVPLLKAAKVGLAVVESEANAIAVVSAGQTDTNSGTVAGEAIDRASALEVATPGLWTDLESARLIGDRFSLEIGAGVARITGEQRKDSERLFLGRPTPTVGRRAELAQLEALVDAVVDEGEPRLAIVVGEAGRGKSRLRYELLRAVTSHRATVAPLVVRFEPSSSGAPWRALGRALTELGDLRALGLEAASLAFLAEIADLAGPEEEALLGVARGSPENMRAGVQRAVVQLLSALAGESAVLLALEDAHWADLSTLQLVDELAAMSSLAVAIVAFARPELRAPLGGMWAKRGALQVDLAPLGERGARRLAQTLLPEGVSETVIVDIASKSDGIPLVIEELVRAYVDAGQLVASLTARTVFEANIARLSPRERLVIRAAAIVGELFWDGAVRACLAGTGIELDEVLADLAGHEMITRRPSSRIAGNAEYVFRHALLRDAAAASTPEDVRKELHRAVATWLQGQAAADSAQLAHHAEAAGMTELAAQALFASGRDSLRAGDLATGIEQLERALERLRDAAPETFEAHALLERAYRATSDRAARLRHLEGLRAALLVDDAPLDSKVVALTRQAAFEGDDARLSQALDTARKATMLARSNASADAVVNASITAGLLLRDQGSQHEALAQLGEAFPRVEHASLPTRAEFYRVRGTLARRLGRVDEAVACYRTALTLVEGAPIETIQVQNSLGYALYTDWHLAEARDSFTAALRLLEDARARKSRAKVTANLGNIGFAIGDLDSAATHFNRAIALHRADSDLDGFADALALRGRIALRQHDLEAASGFLDEAMSLSERSGDVYDRSHVGIALGELALAADNAADALRHYTTAFELAETTGLASTTSLALAGRSLAALAVSQPEHAIEDVERSVQVLVTGGSLEWAAEVYAALARVFEATGAEALGAILEHAEAWLRKVRRVIGDEEYVRSFDARAEVRRVEAALRA